MQFTKTDLQQVQNLATALKKGKFLLEVEEALALSECMKWLANLAKQIQLDIQSQESVPPNAQPSTAATDNTSVSSDKNNTVPKKKRNKPVASNTPKINGDE